MPHVPLCIYNHGGIIHWGNVQGGEGGMGGRGGGGRGIFGGGYIPNGLVPHLSCGSENGFVFVVCQWTRSHEEDSLAKNSKIITMARVGERQRMMEH